MELKVYVEGIQRVVCGVTEATTCQDVVIALAHAIGKTGRFTLIEKWRNNERLLAPSEHPLKVLQKWGEYAADVMFILKYSEKESHEGSAPRTDKFLHDFTPHEMRWSGRSSGRGLKKSLTFSGAHSLTSPKPSRNRHPRRGLPNDSSMDSLDERSSLASCSSRSSASPYASLENRHLRHRNVPFQQVNPFGSLDRHKRTQAVRPSLHFSPHSGSGGSATSSLERRPRRTLPFHGPSRSFDGQHTNHHEDTRGVIEEYDLDRHLAELPPKVNGIGGFREPHLAEKEAVGSSGGDREDLLKLVKLQEERLGVQESQMKVLDSEIGFWEEREKEQDSKIKVIQEEIESLNRQDIELEDQIQELDLVSWVDKLEIEKQRQKTLQSELTLLRSKVSTCEAQILHQKSKLHELVSAMDKEKSDRIKEERAEQQRDMKVLKEISQLHKEINAKLEEHKVTSENLEKLQNEVKELDAALLDQKAKAKDTERDLRETNLYVFMASPSSTDPTQSKQEEKPFPRRPNSARKLMHSPIFLKDSVPTANNPAGYWV